MSMIIIGLLVIVLVVAVVLKKREGQQKTAPKKESINKSASKKPVARPMAEKQEEVAAPQQATAISDNLRQKLDQLIQGNHFQTAEAQINQALKNDSSQHELYIYLLNLHIAQKDDIAIDRLLDQVKALHLDSIIETAEAKIREYEQNKQAKVIEAQTSSRPAPSMPDNTAAFDALVQSSSTQSFDNLQSELSTPAATEEKVEAPSASKDLDFNFSFESAKAQDSTATPAPKEKTEAKSDLQALDFNFSVDPVKTEEVTEIATETAKEDKSDQAPLEFTFNVEPTTPSEPSAPQAEESQPSQPTGGLEFTLTDLNSSSAATESTATEAKAPVETAPSLDFEVQPTSDLSTEQTAETVSEVVAAPVVEPTASATTAQNDPLMTSFPELQQLDEAQLNLELAEQYIELGAADSARKLLQNKAVTLNAEQQQRAEILLNKIAT